MTTIQPIILCGGSGTRLWPASRAKYPKQFMRLADGGTLFAETLQRMDYLDNALPPLIVSNNDYRFYAKTALDDAKKDGLIILEPLGRNTAPAIALAAFCSLEKEDSILLVLPSDHRFAEPEKFCHAVKQAQFAAEAGKLVTFGIAPTAPETGYGYIQQGEPIGNGVYAVNRFLEKPNVTKAKSLLEVGGYFWNSGIFLFRASVFLSELKRFAPDIYNACQMAWQERTLDIGFVRPSEAFCNSPSDSIDYGVMEHTDLSAIVPVDCGWSDMGSWDAFYDNMDKTKDGNVCVGDVIAENSQNCYFRSSGRLIAALDVYDLAVIETADAILVADRRKTQNVKKIVDRLKNEDRSEYDFHTCVYRPWGNYETLALSERFQVKRIVVKPGEENSLQYHYHRAEHWIVVSGTAEVTTGDTKKLLVENESVYIPLGSKHRIRNPGTIPLVFIEVQVGSYVGEDDIVRIEDAYGRADKV